MKRYIIILTLGALSFISKEYPVLHLRTRFSFFTVFVYLFANFSMILLSILHVPTPNKTPV